MDVKQIGKELGVRYVLEGSRSTIRTKSACSWASQLSAELITNEARRAGRTPAPDSMDLYLQGMAWLNKGINPDDIARARGFFERALALACGGSGSGGKAQCRQATRPDERRCDHPRGVAGPAPSWRRSVPYMDVMRNRYVRSGGASIGGPAGDRVEKKTPAVTPGVSCSIASPAA
jgi:hypothetical protein